MGRHHTWFVANHYHGTHDPGLRKGEESREREQNAVACRHASRKRNTQSSERKFGGLWSKAGQGSVEEAKRIKGHSKSTSKKTEKCSLDMEQKEAPGQLLGDRRRDGLIETAPHRLLLTECIYRYGEGASSEGQNMINTRKIDRLPHPVPSVSDKLYASWPLSSSDFSSTKVCRVKG